MANIAILGTGSWGTAVSLLLHGNGHTVCMWDIDRDLVREIRESRQNKKFLPDIRIPENIVLYDKLADLGTDVDCLIFAIPSHGVRAVVQKLPPLPDKTIIVSLAKGIEDDTLLRVSEILAEKYDPGSITVLSGPSHAEEVSKNIPTVVVCASENLESARWVQNAFMAANFRVYVHNDVIGVELGAALKNVVALAAGISDGVGAGDNTKAALMTRGMAEITRLGTKLGADSLTFAGLSGMGDLIVTCMSKHSRNRYLGEQIGRGKSLQQALAEMVMVAEGVNTTHAAFQLAKQHDVEVPIINEVYQILFGGKNPKNAVYDLMTRAAKFED